MDFIIRTATKADVPAIHHIRNHYILHTDATVNARPRQLMESAAWLDETAEKYPFLVAEMGGQAVAYAYLSRYRAADGYDQTAEVSVYVSDGYGGRGIGPALLRQLCAEAPKYGLDCLVSCIVAGNARSVEMHRRAGFETRGVLPAVAHKDGRRIDIVIMTKILPPDMFL